MHNSLINFSNKSATCRTCWDMIPWQVLLDGQSGLLCSVEVNDSTANAGESSFPFPVNGHVFENLKLVRYARFKLKLVGSRMGSNLRLHRRCWFRRRPSLSPIKTTLKSRMNVSAWTEKVCIQFPNSQPFWGTWTIPMSHTCTHIWP